MITAPLEHRHCTLWRSTYRSNPHATRSDEEFHAEYAKWLDGLVDVPPADLEQMDARAAEIEANGCSAFDAGWYEVYTARLHGYKHSSSAGIVPDDHDEYARGRQSASDLESSLYSGRYVSHWQRDVDGVYRSALPNV